MSTTPPSTWTCMRCRAQRNRNDYSNTQWKKGPNAKCKTCIGADISNAKAYSLGNSHNSSNLEPTPVRLEQRPQRAVPGFDGLTVCCDWPQTRNGKPPNAQSLIYNPLLACALGQPIEGHCTLQELELAIKWWSLALPAWPKWIKCIRDVLAENSDLCTSLFRTSRGRPNALIPKTKGRGTVPHFNGKLQNEILEMAPETALEVYACVTCLYSSAAMEDTPALQEKEENKEIARVGAGAKGNE